MVIIQKKETGHMTIGSRMKLPVGIESFEEIRTEGFYYIDKTGLIRELLEGWGKVNLFTRPRRFGKSLNMSMLKSFFEIGAKKELFEGLAIFKERALCEEYMGQFPVISITFKGIEGTDFQTARGMLRYELKREIERYQFLIDSDRLTEIEKQNYYELLNLETQEIMQVSLALLARLLYKHFGKKVMILIDEYDVPLAKAQQNGYYEEMTALIRGIFEQALKTNDSLYFAVLTGCLRVSKESIFTGLNNPKIFSIADVRCDEYFGFTDDEVLRLLDYYGFSEQYHTVKEWYDGYHFGHSEVYCPWDVICYVDDLCQDPEACPQEYWMNTSSNDIIHTFLSRAKSATVKRQIERLMDGETIIQTIQDKLTYKEMYDSIENMWSVLFMTGYLTQHGKAQGRKRPLVIPNIEIKNIFSEQILEYFFENEKQDGKSIDILCNALKNGDSEGAEIQFTYYLNRIISIRDTAVQKKDKENFYHGMLLGLLGFKESWSVSSNRESGDGFADILIETEDKAGGTRSGIVIEMKYSETENMDTAIKEAQRQVEERNYAAWLWERDCEPVLKYGIACHKKQCRVVLI